MAERSPGTLPAVQPSEDRLDSWKEIAAYLNRDVTTAQRWEKREAMPVHRHLHDRMGSVYASRAELDDWARGRKIRGLQENGDHPIRPVPSQAVASPSRSKRRFFLLLTAVAAVLAIGAILSLQKADYFWRNPLEGVRFQTVTDFDGVARDAALSRDGHFVAFLSDHDGQMDVWVSQVGSGEFHNLTRGSAPELVNSAIRPLGFSADASLVTYWVRKVGASNGGGIGIWAAPTLGGQPRPYLENAAEFDWSYDGSRLAYHTPGPGDPLFVSDAIRRSETHPIFTAPAGLHSHFPLWSPDSAFIYFVEGALPDKLDIWRIAPNGGAAERITSHSSYVGYPVLLNRQVLLYLANDADGSGPWLYGMNLAHRIPHRLTSGPERYTSLAASADGRRLAVTLATPKRTLWHLPIADSPSKTSTPTPLALSTGAGFFPRFGPNYFLYVASAGGSDSIWKLESGTGAELWSAPGARILAAPVISHDGRSIAFSVRQNARSRLYVMQADGTNAHPVSASLDLQGASAWAPDDRAVISAANERGVPHLFRLPVDHGAPVPFVKEYAVDPVWSPDGRFLVYSGADIGTTFSLKAVKPDGTAYPMPSLSLTRGARHVVFAPGNRSLLLLRGEIRHKDLWAHDLQTGAERQLTKVPLDFDIHEFDVSPDGRDVVLERVQERSDIVLLDLASH